VSTPLPNVGRVVLHYAQDVATDHQLKQRGGKEWRQAALKCANLFNHLLFAHGNKPVGWRQLASHRLGWTWIL
jgi:hypothetical protein